MSVKKTFDKPALTIEQQIELLVSRGLYIDDTSLAHKVLSNVNYYHPIIILKAIDIHFMTETNWNIVSMMV